MKTCPKCHQKGVPVGSETPQSLLEPSAKARIGDAAYRFCESPDCEVVYFADDGESTFHEPDLTVRVGIKESEAARPLCYCFDHTTEEIEKEVARTGASTVLEDIKTKMKDGCWCETTNPRGRCCLGTVSKAIKAAQARHGDSEPVGEAPEAQPDCCRPGGMPRGRGRQELGEGPIPPSRRGSISTANGHGLWASGGAVLTAILSSTCCWVPLSLMAFSVSGATMAAKLESWRPWLSGATALFLGIAFFLVYRRRGPTIQRTMLWTAAAVALAFGLFPNFLGAFWGERTANFGTEAVEVEEQTIFAVEGMSCEGCANGLGIVLRELPGVETARVSYDSNQAVVGFPQGSDATTEDVLAVIRRSG